MPYLRERPGHASGVLYPGDRFHSGLAFGLHEVPFDAHDWGVHFRVAAAAGDDVLGKGGPNGGDPFLDPATDEGPSVWKTRVRPVGRGVPVDLSPTEPVGVLHPGQRLVKVVSTI